MRNRQVEMKNLFPTDKQEETAFEVAVAAFLSSFLFQLPSSSIIEITIGLALLLTAISRKLMLGRSLVSAPSFNYSTIMFLHLLSVAILYITMSISNNLVEFIGVNFPVDSVWMFLILLYLIMILLIILCESATKEVAIYLLIVVHNRLYSKPVYDSIFPQIRQLLTLAVEYHGISTDGTELSEFVLNSGAVDAQVPPNYRFYIGGIVVLVLAFLANHFWQSLFILFIASFGSFLVLGLFQFLLMRFGHTEEEKILSWLNTGLIILIAYLIMRIEYDVVLFGSYPL